MVDDEELLELVEMEVREIIKRNTDSQEMTYQVIKDLH